MLTVDEETFRSWETNVVLFSGDRHAVSGSLRPPGTNDACPGFRPSLDG